MIETKEIEIDKNLLEANFYNRPFQFSYSSLNKLLTAPSVFYKEYVLGEKEARTEKYLIEGVLIHYLLLDGRAFDEKFMVLPDTMPSENSIKVVQHVFQIYTEQLSKGEGYPDAELCDFPKEIIEALEEIGVHQSLKDDKDLNKPNAKTGDQKRLAKILEPKAEEYFKYLKEKGQREIIDSGMLDKCTRRADLLKTNEEVREVLGLDLVSDGTTVGVYEELPLDMELEGLPFGLKGILDNMVVDVKGKTVRINDFKTTGKSLQDFPDSVEYWNYWLQAAIYLTLAMEYLKAVIDDSWKFEFNFVVFDRYDQMYIYPVSNETMKSWLTRMNDSLKEAFYHYNEKDYKLPYKFVAGKVSL